MLNISVRHVPTTFPCVCAQVVILFQLHVIFVIFGPAILSQLHEICCTEFNMLNISVGHVPATFSCVCAAFDFVPPNMFPLHVASEHTTDVFYHCNISLHHDSSYLQTLTNVRELRDRAAIDWKVFFALASTSFLFFPMFVYRSL